MKKLKLTFEEFEKFDIERQAEIIEKQTKQLLKKLPSLKKNLSLYDDTTDELYNLTPDELSLYGETYARAIRGGEISTPSSKQGYQRFVKRMLNYNARSIKELALEYANRRMDSFMNTIRENGSLAEIEYADSLYKEMSDADKIAFTRSKYFLDTDNWNSKDFKKAFQEDEYSMMTLKLELFMMSRGYHTDNIYNQAYYGSDEQTVRPSSRGKIRRDK